MRSASHSTKPVWILKYTTTVVVKLLRRIEGEVERIKIWRKNKMATHRLMLRSGANISRNDRANRNIAAIDRCVLKGSKIREWMDEGIFSVNRWVVVSYGGHCECGGGDG